MGTVRALNWSKNSSFRVFRETGYGAVQGAGEIGASVAQAASQAIAGAREAAQELGISQEEAAAQAAEGVLAAAESMGPEAVAEIKEALPVHFPAPSPEFAPGANTDLASETSRS